jgi:hypothetical protein
MLRLLSDADFNGRVYSGVMRRAPGLDFIRVQDVGLRMAKDPVVLEWAASDGRIVVSRDRKTMIRHAYDRIRARLLMPGLIIVDDATPIGVLVQELLIAAYCSSQSEWENKVEFLPL